MKTFFSFTSGVFLLLFTATCNNLDNSFERTGTLQKQGITTYQYGTHVLSSEDTFYALTSDSVDLDDYIDKKITVKAIKIEGYPVDGGPEYLRVLQVK